MISQAKQILKWQTRNAWIVLGVGGLVLIGIFHFLTEDIAPPISKREVKVELPVDRVNAQDIWMNRQDSVLDRLEAGSKVTDQKMKLLEELLLMNQKKEDESEKEKLELKKTIVLLQKDLQRLSSEIQESKVQETIHEEFSPTSLPISAPISSSSVIKNDPFISYSSCTPPLLEEEMECSVLRAPLREYTMEMEQKVAFSVDEGVPAAVSVKALLVSSVDAVCGVYSNSDPIPVKLRLLDDGHLPKGVTVPLKGCLVLASAYGNISNERVYMRLERLTQVNPEGEAIETEVVGYVSGEDGKFGIRGTVVDRSAKIVKNAAASGFLGGIGQVLQASVTRNSIDSWNTYSLGTNAAAKGAANGASSAFDMLAEYYIKRAEQVQPVLQVNAGRIVDITFTHGFAMGDLNTKEKLQQIRQKHGRRG